MTGSDILIWSFVVLLPVPLFLLMGRIRAIQRRESDRARKERDDRLYQDVLALMDPEDRREFLSTLTATDES